ncbi:hypothetical protein E1B28_009538 [Marasmius oreades]|uniref:Uncharacterized protein n=1 Tax=Marasmius oreades TaxID=181124 RepID=A0A9P7RVB4_9AGAR|nr:uncharacterized protein E1B28_009538 [Marasmius oreades]KAG7090419.1 hypothetical protein E1B28_009538 [Marasmius oreades]
MRKKRKLTEKLKRSDDGEVPAEATPRETTTTAVEKKRSKQFMEEGGKAQRTLGTEGVGGSTSFPEISQGVEERSQAIEQREAVSMFIRSGLHPKASFQIGLSHTLPAGSTQQRGNFSRQ